MIPPANGLWAKVNAVVTVFIRRVFPLNNPLPIAMAKGVPEDHRKLIELLTLKVRSR